MLAQLLLLASYASRGEAYTAGNLLVLKVQQAGCGPGPSCSGSVDSAAFSITELATTGSVATGAVSIPSTTCQMSSEYPDGRLTRSEDGTSVSFACYNAGGTTTNVDASFVGRVIGSISATGAQTFVTNLQPGGAYNGGAFSSAVRLSSGSFYGAGEQFPRAAFVTSTGTVTCIAGTSLLRVAVYAGTLYATPSAGGNCQLLRIGDVGTLPQSFSTVASLGQIGPGNINSQGVAASPACGGSDYATGFVFQSPTALWSCVWGGGGHLGVYSFAFASGAVQATNYVRAQSSQACLDITGQFEGSQWVVYYVSIDSHDVSYVMRMPAVAGYATYPIAQTTGTSASYQGIALVPLPSTPATPTQTNTPAPSSSKSPTSTATPSRTQPPTPSSTPTRSASPTPTPSRTGTATPSSTRTPSRSGTLTPSSTGSGSVSPSQINSGTHSVTPSQEVSPSETASQTLTSSITASESSSPSPSSTGSPTVSPTTTRTCTQAASPSPSQAQSATPSATGTASFSASPTPSQAETTSQTASPSASLPVVTASPSTRPYFLLLQPAAQASLPLAISDALPPLDVDVALDRCSTDSLFLRCGATPDLANTSEALGLSQQPGSSTGLGPRCAADGTAPAPLPITLRVGANFRTGGGPATLACEAFSAADGRSVAAGSLALQVTPTQWPTFSQAFVVSREGLLRSTAGGSALNATAALLAVGCSIVPNCSVEAAAQDPETVLAVAQAWWGAGATGMASSGGAAAAPFSVTLTGSTALVLNADQTGAFSGLVSVKLGDVACDGVVSSVDGKWLAFRTPPAALMCPGLDARRDCGYVSLSLSNPAASDESLLGGSIECPPFCPGVTGVSLVPLATGAENASAPVWVPATPAAPGGLAAPTTVSSATSLGIYYALACSATGLYTDPTTGSCANASDPASTNCAFGSGDSCQRCPAGGLCPGGSRCWSRPGYYSVSENSVQLTPCPPPQSSTRCAGWGAGVAATTCGPGYLQGSYLCSVCAPTFYSVGDGTCASCPVIAGAWERYKGLMELVGGVIAFAVLVYACLIAIVRVAGGTVVGGAGRLAALVVWAITTAQVVSQVARVSSPSVPPLMAALYRAVAVLQLEGIVLPPECTGAYPFESEVAVMIVALVLEAFAAALIVARRFSRHPWASGKAAGFAGRVALTGAVVLYPTVVADAVGLVHCNTVTVSARALGTLDGGSSVAATAAADGGVSVALLSSNPYIVCWAGSHAPAGRLAAATIPFFVLLFPLGVLVALITDPMLRWHLARRALRRRTKSGLSSAPTAPPHAHEAASEFVRANPLAEVLGRAGSARTKGPSDGSSGEASLAAAPPASQAPRPAEDPALAPFLAEYLYAAWWFKHVDLGTLAVLAVLQGLLPRPATVQLVAAKATLSCLALAALLVVVALRRPFSATDAWKGPVKVALILLSVSCVALNASAATVDILQDAGGSTASLVQSVSAGSYILFIACVATAIVLVGSFARALIRAAREEQEGIAAQLDPREKRVQRLRTPLAPAVGATSPATVIAAASARSLQLPPLDTARADGSRVSALFRAGAAPSASSRVGWGATASAASRGRRPPSRRVVGASVRQMHSGYPASAADGASQGAQGEGSGEGPGGGCEVPPASASGETGAGV